MTCKCISVYFRYFLNPESVSHHLYCSICQEVFVDPQRAPCGHSFCRKVGKSDIPILSKIKRKKMQYMYIASTVFALVSARYAKVFQKCLKNSK